MDVITHNCPNCGGALTFKPDDQKFHCPFCFSIFTEKEVTDFEEKQKQARLADEKTTAATETATSTAEPDQVKATTKAQQAAQSQTKAQAATEVDLYLCPSCGAEIATDQTTAATYCYFCHNPVVLSGRLSGAFLPNKVLPFKIDEQQAKTQFLAWTKKKRFIPKAFFNAEQVEKLTGVYFPYWVVNAKTHGKLVGTGTALRVWIVGNIEYTETKQYQVTRDGDITFSDLVKNALSKNTQKKMVESVQPFPVDQAIDFKSQYLQGFQAEKRDIEFQDLAASVKQELNQYAEQALSSTVNGYTHFSPSHTETDIIEEENQYMLLPVWLVTYANGRNEEPYYYAMNGQTGKVSGVLPISYRRLGLTSAGIFAAIAALALLVGYFI
jgi:uncharacterized Zn finger protein (UPF0148 family)